MICFLKVAERSKIMVVILGVRICRIKILNIPHMGFCRGSVFALCTLVKLKLFRKV